MSSGLHSLRREEGSALMFVAVGLPVLLAVFAIVLNVGNWFVHKRDIQNQVDAAAFAGSQLWGSCFQTTPSWLPMQKEARNYDGQPGFTHDYNPQVGGAFSGQFDVAFNSTTFPLNQPPGVAPDDTPIDPCTPVTLADGQKHYFFDVKATEKDSPFIFGVFPGVTGPSIHATARTELRQVKSLSGLLPIGVQDPSPRWMYAQFVDESASDSPLTGWIPLCKVGSTGCAGSPGVTNERWTTQTTTPVSIASKDVGVRLKYVWGGPDSNPACGTILADCYDNVPSATQSNGLVHIRGWTTGLTGVHLESVWMLQGACTDGYFAGSPCDAGIQAEADLGNHPVANPWTTGNCDGGCAQIWATVDGSGAYQLSPPSLPLSGLATWTLTSGLTLGSTGPHQVALLWKWKQTAGTWTGHSCTTTGSNPCTDNGSFNGGNAVQRPFVADNGLRSGPVEGVHVWSSAVTSGANSFPQGTTQNLGVTVENPCFETELTNPNCPLVYLRVSTQITGSQSQSLDCDPSLSTLRDELQYGCSPSYALFPQTPTETSCPTQSVLWSVANPPNDWDCVAVQTGNQAGQVSQGLQARIGTDAATCANTWPNFPGNDKRQVSLFLVPFSALTGSGGNATFPVIGFGAFYVTGYRNDPCPNATPSVPQGTIAGYFITYVPDGNVKPSTKPCDPLALTPCIPVLVK